MTDNIADVDAILHGEWHEDDPDHARCIHQLLHLANAIGHMWTPGDAHGNKAIALDAVAKSDVAFAVWEEEGKPFGIGTLLVKGEKACLELSDTATPVLVCAIPFDHPDDASHFCAEVNRAAMVPARRRRGGTTVH